MSAEREIVIYTDSKLIRSVTASIGGVDVPTRILPTSQREERNRSLHPVRYLRVVGADGHGDTGRCDDRGAKGNGDS